MNNDLDAMFAALKRRRQKALVTYLAAGYPPFAQQKNLIKRMVESGADVVEVGIPFSDPIADGPTIQYASQKALENGVTMPKILKWIAALKKEVTAPVVVMTYINPVLAFGVKQFAAAAARSGVSGVIIPDLIPEESGDVRRQLSAKKIHLIHLVAPTTPKNRQAAIARMTGGFLYAVSVTGVTGARRELPKETKGWLASLRRLSGKPVCVGFGISGPDQVRQLRDGVDGFIVGSALIDIVRKNKPASRTAAMEKFVHALSKECRHGR